MARQQDEQPPHRPRCVFPPFWKQDSHYVTVEFSKTVDLTEDEELKIEAEGSYNIKINGKMLSACPRKLLWLQESTA